jgi:hypothetical protein
VPQETPIAPDAAAHLEHPSTGRPPAATFSELLFGQSERPPHVMPTGLMIALLAVSTLESVPPANVNEVPADIWHNLDWADAELRSVAVTTYSIKHWLQLEMARASRCFWAFSVQRKRRRPAAWMRPPKNS